MVQQENDEMALESINPNDGTHIESYDEFTDEQVDRTIDAVHSAWETWRTTEYAQRTELLENVADVLRRRKPKLAALMTKEMGKLYSASEAEVDKCVWVCEYYARNGKEHLVPQPVETDASKSYVTYNPLGVVLAVMPWNFPLWQVFRFAAPAVMAGNAALLKHASNVSGCALVIEEIFKEGGAPANLFRTLLIGGRRVPSVIEDRRVAAVTLTGSTEAGRSVGSTAGNAIKKSVLELGGSDAYVVLSDADLQLAAETCVKSRMINGGQSCIAAKRLIVVHDVAEEFTERVVELMRDHAMGDPMESSTTLGPMARADLRDELHDQVKRSVEAGATLLLGGAIPEGAGAFYPPTVLTGVGKDNPAYSEELFGPVAVIITVDDEADAIRTANDSVFGLGAAVFSKDVERAERIAAQELQAGHCAVNAFVKSDPRLPFGGIKTSGYGRELSWYGIKEFVNIKTVFIG
jgi:succinate-semialdehyde dehydrogenase/glutarate-semialdehyde dehydrogenase